MPDTITPRWSHQEIGRIYRQPLLQLIEEAHAVHRMAHPEREVQLCHLLSIKTGGCPEDCSYCPQSARYETGVDASGLMEEAEVLAAARQAQASGSTRFCMGAAWRQVREGAEFERVLSMVRGVSGLGLEVCCTLGMLTAGQAARLGEAGLTAYNHNLDTSPEFYGQIITTRNYEDRLRTLEHVREAGISVCCGGILGLGESENDRIRLLGVLANMPTPPESVPINALVAVEGTPLAQQPRVGAFEFVRAIATARILMPSTKVRLSAGRLALSEEAQALCFYAGANSIFVGDKLLTTPNPGVDHDHALLEELGLKREPSRAEPRANASARPWERALEEEMEGWGRAGRLRELRPAQGEDFCSNDYLGLARHPLVRAAMERALRDGIELGSTGSRLVRGNHPAIEGLERKFAAWRGSQGALLFSSGYAANLAVLGALVRPGDLVFSDRLNHASLIDGMRLSGARRIVVRHGDVEALAEELRRHPVRGEGRRWLVVESVYSMEGDRARLGELAGVCAAGRVGMIVDEAHATGLLGRHGGGGVCEELLESGVDGEVAATVVATIHPCGKALGAAGAVVASSAVVREYLVNHGRSFVYSTAPSPLLGVQLAAALDVVVEEPELRQGVFALARRLRGQVGISGGDSRIPIIPVRIGEDGAAVAVAAELQARGWDVRAIRPPTVPEGTARLRLTVHAGQTGESVDGLAAALRRALTPAGAGPAPRR